MSRGRQRRERVKAGQQRAARKAQRRRTRRAGSGPLAAATAVALGLAGAPVGNAAPPAAEEDSAELLVDGRTGPANSYPSRLTAVAGQVFFGLTDDDHGGELWRSDGTAAGTVLVKDIKPGSEGSYPSLLTAAGSTLFFAADDGSGRALWKSDGTTVGTVKVASVEPDGMPYSELGVAGDTIFFPGRDDHGLELWRSDGTTAGTVLVKDIDPGSHDYYGEQVPNGSYPSNFASAGGVVFFLADDNVHGSELWRTDGTEAGTVLVKDIVPGARVAGLSYLTAVGGTLFFTADDAVNGEELWESDGTAAGTVMVKDIYPGSYHGFPNSGAPRGLTAANDVLYFSAQDSHGFELWKSDGSTAGTVLVRDINPDDDPYYTSSLPKYFTPVGGTVFFSADDGVRGRELWRTDGTGSGTVLVEDLHPGTYDDDGYVYPNSGNPEGLMVSAGTLFFAAADGRGEELWSSDGTAAGTGLVSDIWPGQVGSRPDGMTAISGGGVVFSANDGVHGVEVWRASAFEPPPPPPPPPPPAVPSNEFTLPKRGAPDTAKGTLTLSVSLPGPGSLRLGPSGRSPVKVAHTSVAGSTSVTIKLTKAGKKQLRKRLLRALADGRKVGKLKVVAAATFTPQGGVARTVTRRYTLKLKASSADQRPG